jgi:hypothetical protein
VRGVVAGVHDGARRALDDKGAGLVNADAVVRVVGKDRPDLADVDVDGHAALDGEGVTLHRRRSLVVAMKACADGEDRQRVHDDAWRAHVSDLEVRDAHRRGAARKHRDATISEPSHSPPSTIRLPSRIR